MSMERKEEFVPSQPCGDEGPKASLPHTQEPAGAFTPSQLALLRQAVHALDWAKGHAGSGRLPGQMRVFDGRKWPAIRRLRDLGLITVDDYDGRGHHDVITIMATEAARDTIAKAEGRE